MTRIDMTSGDGAGELPTTIVLAVDASTVPSLAVRAIARVAVRGAEVVVLHVHEVDRQEGCLVDHKIGIVEVARQVNAGMIVVGVRSESALGVLHHGGVGAEVIRRSPVPVLVWR